MADIFVEATFLMMRFEAVGRPTFIVFDIEGILEPEEKKMEINNGEGSGESDKKMMEMNKVELMRSLLQTQDPSAKEVVDDLMIRRFLRARDQNIEKAADLLLGYLRWRKDFVRRGSISEADVQYELSQMKVFLQGSDRRGRPISVVLGGRHIPTKGKEGLQEFKRLMAYCLDKICASIPRGEETFINIMDLQGWGYSNSDFRGYLGGLSILQDYYPERLGRIYMINVPPMFMAAWKVISQFIDNNSKRKIVFVEKQKLRETLLNDIEEEQLPEIYGGKLPLVPIQNT